MAEGLFGDAMATNNFMVGVAFQAGTIPLKAESIETAIKNSGVGVEQSLAAFRWGRMAVVDRAFVEAEIAKYAPKVEQAAAVGRCARDRRCGRRAGRDQAPARSARARPDRLPGRGLRQALCRRDQACRAPPRRRPCRARAAWREAAARYLYKLMAYKDEYEVARLHTDPAFLAKLDAQFKHGYTVKYNLAPPTISKRDPVTGHLHQAAVRAVDAAAPSGWLTKFKGLRGGALDIFGKTEERRHERQMIEDYIKELDDICASSSPANHAAAVALASVPDEIRGYGHVKEKSVVAAKEAEARLREAFRNPPAMRAVA